MRHRHLVLACLLSLTAAGCFKTTTPGASGSKGSNTRGDFSDEPKPGRGDEPTKPIAGKPPTNDPNLDPDQGVTDSSERCIRGGLCGEIETTMVEAADLLFVVDNSGSMRQEQASLREQFPRLISLLATGETSAGARYPAVRDLHLGVVSTDMGLAGIANNFPGCNTQRHINGGDDGVLLHPGNTGPNCQPAYPPFLEFSSEGDDPGKLAQDFGCIAALGTTGCGFEQPLEAALKALWPKTYVDAAGNVFPPERNPILFLSTTQEGRLGHGDVPIEQGGNAGFLRNASRTLLGIVVVTDEEDCSSKNTNHFVSTNDPQNPLSKQGINLRCYYNKQNLFEIDRYVKGFAGLKPGHESDVVFAAIVGVPRELTSAEFRAGFDFSERTSRDEYYDAVLRDERMIERPMNENVPAIANVAPSCSRLDKFGERADAYPPRRIVEVARGMGENAILQSICQDDFSPAIDGVVELLRSRAQLNCLPRQLKRSEGGRVSCDVLWELPREGTAAEGVPVRCGDRKFLSDVSRPRAPVNDRGGRVCKVAQLPVDNGEPGAGEGFYYDDFSPDLSQICRSENYARIAFSAGAQPQSGVRVFLDCAR
ncbi:MAG TPA: hypothetical protein VJR89_38940 [Polyangiales bacterium]|nr:hypothetical protein [Polyangiales bacterium]